jgi:hypothetical protein
MVPPLFGIGETKTPFLFSEMGSYGNILTFWNIFFIVTLLKAKG